MPSARKPSLASPTSARSVPSRSSMAIRSGSSSFSTRPRIGSSKKRGLDTIRSTGYDRWYSTVQKGAPDLDRHPAHTGFGPGRLSGGSMTIPAASLDRLLVAAGIDPASGVQVGGCRPAGLGPVRSCPPAPRPRRPGCPSWTRHRPYPGATRALGRQRCSRRCTHPGTRSGRFPMAS